MTKKLIAQAGWIVKRADSVHLIISDGGRSFPSAFMIHEDELCDLIDSSVVDAIKCHLEDEDEAKLNVIVQMELD